ncbi:hypothetical protein YC2023_083608 [Brassica napus]
MRDVLLLFPRLFLKTSREQKDLDIGCERGEKRMSSINLGALRHGKCKENSGENMNFIGKHENKINL